MASATLPNSPALSFTDLILHTLSAKHPRPLLFMCDYVDEHTYCRDKGTVHCLATEEDLCVRHFQQRVKEGA